MTGDRLFLAGTGAGVVPARQVELGFARDHGGRTYLKRQRAAYPFHVGRVLHAPGDPAGFGTVYLQSCAGGAFGNDRLGLAVQVDRRGQAHLTTGACTIVHSMNEGHALQDMVLDAGQEAIAEYLPDPMILFPRSRLDTRLTIRAHASSTVIAADSYLMHDPNGADEPFDWLHAETRIEDEQGRALAIDRFRLAGATAISGNPGINGARPMQATVMVVHRQDPQLALDALRSVCAGDGAVYAGASLLPNDCGAWLRAIASDAPALRRLVREAWAAARLRLTGAPPGVRRK